MAGVRHSTLKVGPVTVFYREAGLEGNPVLLLLHGFANSSHYFRHLMPQLANRFHHLLAVQVRAAHDFESIAGQSVRHILRVINRILEGRVFVGAVADDQQLATSTRHGDIHASYVRKKADLAFRIGTH